MDDQAALAWITPVIQLATAGGFGALVWYLVIKHIPTIEARHRSERIEWLAYIKARDKDFENIALEMMKFLERLEAKLNSLK